MTISTNFPEYDVVRRIWGRVDTILFIFAGSAAEFALNKAVDWLFVTGELPGAPIERFFETVRFAQTLVFEDPETFEKTVQAVNQAHKAVESLRDGQSIPQRAYRDTLFMLVDYAERAHEVVFGPLTESERQSLFLSSMEIGRCMNIKGLPDTYDEYRRLRQSHIRNHLARSRYSDQLYEQYRSHIGPIRMRGMLDVQASLVPPEVAQMLSLRQRLYTKLLLKTYRRIQSRRLLRLFYPLILPRRYVAQLRAIDR